MERPQSAPNKESSYVHSTLLHKLPEYESSTNIRSPFTVVQSHPFTPKTPRNVSNTKSIVKTTRPQQTRSYQKSRNVHFGVQEYDNEYFDVPTTMRIITPDEVQSDEVNRVNLLKDEMLYLLRQPIGNILQDMILFKGGDVHDDATYNFSKDDMKKVSSYVEDILLSKSYDVKLSDLYEKAPFSRTAARGYMNRLQEYVDHLSANVHQPLYTLIQAAYYSGLQNTYDYLLSTAKEETIRTREKYDIEFVYLVVQRYLETRAAISELPKTLKRDVAKFIEAHAKQIKNENHFQAILLEVSKMMSVYFHTKTFDYTIVMILLKFLTYKKGVSCKNQCPDLKSDGFHSVDINKKDIDLACIDMYTTMRQQVGKHEINFFLKALQHASGGKCTLFRMSGGNKKRIMIGPKGGRYMMVHGKRKYLPQVAH